MYECEVLADSMAPCGKRLTTVVVTYPRFVHSELLTHRMFSRNSASSRAIPNEKLRQRVIDDPAMPVWWGKNQAGMQAREEIDPSDREWAKEEWLRARAQMLAASSALASVGLHKQLCNRLIEPWMGITVIISATEWENFFRLRCHADAQPEIRVAAEAMRDAINASTPKQLRVGEWHLPLSTAEDAAGHIDPVILSASRCARVSFMKHLEPEALSKTADRYSVLRASGHWSPFEHPAKALAEPVRIGNFIGFRQHRADVDPHFIF